MLKRIIIGLTLGWVGCDRMPPPTPAPFHAEDNVVPVALDPDRPRPPPPSNVEMQRVPRAPSQ